MGIAHTAVPAAASTPAQAALTSAASANSNAVAGLVAPLIAALENLFGVNTRYAPADPVGGLLWGVFRSLNSALGFTPIAGTPTVGTPNPVTGTVTGTWSFTEPAGLDMTYVYNDPSKGAVNVYDDGSFSYTPSQTARQSATSGTTDSFTVVATDAVASTVQTITVPVLPSGVDKPVAGTPTVGTPDAATGTVTGTLGFTDPGGKTLTYSFATNPTKGVTTVYPNGNYSYTPTQTARQNATPGTTDTFSVTASNGVASTTETVTVPVLPSGGVDKPVAGTPTVGTPDPATGVVTGALNFTDPGGKALSYSVTTQGGKGSATVTAAGAYSYTPTQAARQNATPGTTDTFSVTASNGVASTTETVTVPVSPTTATTPKVISTIDVGNTMGLALSPDGSRAYVTTYSAVGSNGVLGVIDTATQKVSYIDIPAIPNGGSTVLLPTEGAVAVSPNGGYLYVANEGAGKVSVISTTTNAVTAVIPVGSQPVGVAVNRNGSLAYVTNTGGNSVSVIDTATNKVTTTIPVGSNPQGVAFSPNGSLAYVTNQGGTTVSAINTTTSNVTATIPVGGQPSSVAFSPNGSRAYVTSNGSGTGLVSVINTTNNTVITTIPVALGPQVVVVSPDGSTAYVFSHLYTSTLSVIDTTTNTVTATVGLDSFTGGGLPGQVAISPDGSYLYAGNGRYVSVISV